MPSALPALFLFDIDGTLLTTGGSGYRSFTRSCNEVLGIDGPIDGINMAGKLDRVIFQEIVGRFRPDSGEDQTDEYWRHFRKRYIELLEIESRTPREWTLLPGVKRIVDCARRRGKLALLTGNVREGAMIKISSLGLARFFPTGGYGEDNITRRELARRAFRRACDFYDTTFLPHNTYVLGDTPNDVKAARAIGANAVAVATGTVPIEELRAAEADLVVEDFDSGAEQVVNFLSR